MFSWFPTAEPDELVYSLLARFAEAMGLDTLSQASRFILGRQVNALHIGLPLALPELVQRLPVGTGLDVHSLTFDHSLFPYFLPFVPAQRQQRALAALFRGDNSTAGRQIGLAHATKFMPAKLRFCEDCLEADRASGTPYWRRTQQLPGLVVCAEHGTVLRETIVGTTYEDLNRRLFTVEEAVRSGPVTRIDAVPAALSVSRRLANDCRWLLTQRAAICAREQLDVAIKGRLQALGFSAFSNLRINYSAVRERLTTAFGENIFSDLRIIVDHSNESVCKYTTENFLSFFRSARAFSFPVVYLLLSQLFYGSFRELVEQPDNHAINAQNSLLQLDSPCGNPVCPDYDPPVPRPLAAGPAHSVEVACPTCGFRYRASPSATKKLQVRIIDTGSLWNAALVELVREGTATVRQMTARLGFTDWFIQRRALALGIWHPRWGHKALNKIEAEVERGDTKREQARERSRAKWCKLMAEHPDDCRRGIGRRSTSTYHQLLRDDRAWLDEICPAKKRSGGRPPTTVAAQLDREFAHAAQSIMMPRGRLQRVTLGLLSRLTTGSRAMAERMRRHPNQLAITMKYIESDEEYWHRGMAHAAHNIVDGGYVFTQKKFDQLGGLYFRRHLPHIYAALIDLLEHDRPDNENAHRAIDRICAQKSHPI